MTAVLLITILLLFAYCILLLFYRRGWLSLPGRPIQKGAPSTRISVIIPARNEEKHIGHCLQSILNGNYPQELYEIIVVNDHSTDNTVAVIGALASPRVKLIHLSDHIHGEQNSYKKLAIDIAIRHAGNALIVGTDADCIPPPGWLASIASLYESDDPVFIAAPVSIAAGSTFIGIFQALDFMMLQGITGAAVHMNVHSMCNGANLAYSKNAFFEVNGFEGIDNIASGDDMLLMHKLYQRYPNRIRFLKSKEAIVSTAAVTGLRDFLRQRVRWASKAGHYKDKRIFAVLALVYLFNVMMLLLPVCAMFSNTNWPVFNVPCSVLAIWGLLLLVKMIAELVLLYPVARFFSQTKMLRWFPFMQPFHILYTVVAGWLGVFGKYRWKDRTVK